MKFIVERDVLKNALPFVMGRTKHRLSIPILSHLLIESVESGIRITGNDLDSCSQIEVQAEVSQPGSTVVPADRVNKLIGGLPDGSNISIETAAASAKLKCGRSVYQFATLSSDDFPGSFEVEESVSISIGGDQIKRLFGMPSVCIPNDMSRPYLNGIYFHHRDGKLAAVATNGHILLQCFAGKSVTAFDGILVPEKSCDEIVRLAADDQCEIDVSKSLLAIRAGGRKFITKLIDGTFPDYQRVIPQAQAPAITITTAEMDAALVRLSAAIDHEEKSGTGRVQLSWGDDVATFIASLQSAGNEGREEIDCDCPGRAAGGVAVNLDYLRSILGAMDGKRTRFYIDGPGEPVRIENPDDEGTVAVVMPLR